MASGSGGPPLSSGADPLSDGLGDAGDAVEALGTGPAASPPKMSRVEDPMRETPQMPMTSARTRNEATMPRASLDSSLDSGSAGTSGAGASKPVRAGARGGVRAHLGDLVDGSARHLPDATTNSADGAGDRCARAGDRCARSGRPRRPPIRVPLLELLVTLVVELVVGVRGTGCVGVFLVERGQRSPGGVGSGHGTGIVRCGVGTDAGPRTRPGQGGGTACGSQRRGGGEGRGHRCRPGAGLPGIGHGLRHRSDRRLRHRLRLWRGRGHDRSADRAADDLSGRPRGHLTGEVAGVGGSLVVVEREAAQGVEVARHSGCDLGRRGDATRHARRGTQARPPGAERPQAGQPGVREGDDPDGVAAAGILGLGSVLADAHRGRLEASEADVAVGGAQDVLGPEVEVVHAAVSGRLEGGCDLAGDPAHLVTGDAALADEPGEVTGLLELLLDDEGDLVVLPDVEDPHEDGVGERSGTSCGIEKGSGAVVVAGDAEHGDASAERRVVGRPPLGVVTYLQPLVNGVAPAQDGAGSNTPHRCSSRS